MILNCCRTCPDLKTMCSAQSTKFRNPHGTRTSSIHHVQEWPTWPFINLANVTHSGAMWVAHVPILSPNIISSYLLTFPYSENSRQNWNKSNWLPYRFGFRLTCRTHPQAGWLSVVKYVGTKTRGSKICLSPGLGRLFCRNDLFYKVSGTHSMSRKAAPGSSFTVPNSKMTLSWKARVIRPVLEILVRSTVA